MRRYSVFVYNVETQVDGSSVEFMNKFVSSVNVDFTNQVIDVRARDSSNGWIYKFLDKLTRDRVWRLFVRLLTDGEGEYAIEVTKPWMMSHAFNGEGGMGEHVFKFGFESRLPFA